MLLDLGVSVNARAAGAGDHPARRWAESGLMALTGHGNKAPKMCPVPLASIADGVLDAFRTVAAADIFPTIRGSHLLAERAALSGLHRNGPISPGGACRLLHTLDGTIGLNLAREDDRELLPALFETEHVGDWESIGELVKENTTATLLDRGRLLGLAVVDAEPAQLEPCTWMTVSHRCRQNSPGGKRPRVIDLSSLWAGPLCSNLWQAAGAEVIKIESRRRPDGARFGPARFFELLNSGKHSVMLDLHEPSGQGQLLELIKQADIVLEGSRPRALKQMGIVAEELIDSVPNLSWVSITGYGRREPRGNWIAYGDDAGVAAGLSAILREATGEWMICGDAIADPLTGLHAALAGWASWLAGGGHLIELSLEQTVRHCITATAPPDNAYAERQRRWERYLSDNHVVARPPRCSRETAPSAP